MELNFHLGTATKKTVQEQLPLTLGSVIACSLQLTSTLLRMQQWFLYFGLLCPLARSHQCYESVVVCKQFWDRDAKGHVMYLWTDGTVCRKVEWTPSEGSICHIQPRLTRDWFFGSVEKSHVKLKRHQPVCHALFMQCHAHVYEASQTEPSRAYLDSSYVAIPWL